MINNLFSVFDPSSALFSFPWILIPIIAVTLPSSIWNTQTPQLKSSNGITLLLNNEIHFSSNKNNSQTPILITAFLVIFLINVSALYPQIFSLTSHLAITLPLSVILWLSINLYGWLNNTGHMLSHLLPQGTPVPLITFIVLIELTSNIIRPITLCVRLTANIIAGHLLITLLGSALLSASTLTGLAFLPVPLILTILETAVALIQSYVFMTLITLYISEV